MQFPVAWWYTTIFVPLLGPLYQMIAQTLATSQYPTRAVWDVGCGDGSLLEIALQQNPDLMGIGIEPSRYLARRATRRLARFASRARVLRCTAEACPEQPDTRDIAVSTGSFKHWRDHNKVLRDIWGSPDTRLIIVELNKRAPLIAIEAFVRQLPLPIRNLAAWQLDHRVLPRSISLDEFKAKVTSALSERELTFYEEGIFLVAHDSTIGRISIPYDR